MSDEDPIEMGPHDFAEALARTQGCTCKPDITFETRELLPGVTVVEMQIGHEGSCRLLYKSRAGTN